MLITAVVFKEVFEEEDYWIAQGLENICVSRKNLDELRDHFLNTVETTIWLGKHLNLPNHFDEIPRGPEEFEKITNRFTIEVEP